MKLFLLVAVFASAALYQGRDDASDTLADPRRTSREWVRGGADVSEVAGLPLLLIHWSPSPDGKVFDIYQISGVPGFHSKERIGELLEAFYSLAKFAPKGPEVPNVFVCGNNWHAGAYLKTPLTALSEKLGFSVFHVGGWSFQKVQLLEEPPARQLAIQRAFEASATNKKETSKSPEPTSTRTP